MVKKVNYCKAWVENTNARCQKKALGKDYCWLHYPKKALLIELLIVAPVTMIATLLFNDPLIWGLSKIPVIQLLVDKGAPVIETVMPDIRRISNVDKKTDVFTIFFSENGSGINYEKSNIKITQKKGLEKVPLVGKIKKLPFEISVSPEKELQNGEYSLEAILVDKVGNKTEFDKPFVVRYTDELESALSRFGIYEKSPHKDMFKDFFENISEKPFKSSYFIYELSLHNKETAVFLKNLSILMTVSGSVICDLKEVANFGGGKVNLSYIAPAMNKEIPIGKIYVPQALLQIDQIDPQGTISLLVLVNEVSCENSGKSWKGISLNGSYQSDGYGTLELRKINRDFPVENGESKIRSMSVIINKPRAGENFCIFRVP